MNSLPPPPEPYPMENVTPAAAPQVTLRAEGLPHREYTYHPAWDADAPELFPRTATPRRHRNNKRYAVASRTTARRQQAKQSKRKNRKKK